MKELCKYGTHRVIHPEGTLPQTAERINNEMICYDNEILVDVDTLNIDSASFTQIKKACESDATKMKEMIENIVNSKGKIQNPVTGSGGMFLGKIKEVGKNLNVDLKPGDKITSLVSLSLTPLKIEKIHGIDLSKDQVNIVGQAILFETGIYAKIPNDLPADIVLSALDVAGAAAQVEKLVKIDDTVLILGAGGKSGILCAYQARKSAGKNGKIIALIHSDRHRHDLEKLGVCDYIIVGDATKPMEVYNKVKEVAPEMVDVTINVVNVQNTEMTSILPTKSTGTIYFFSMATSFTKAALGAEGIASEALMIIGNGYTKDHAEFTLNLLRESKELFEIFKDRYGSVK
ncbi:MAG: L-erythro-3,5-diaminohexanoate dehydrogenase [Candidatus Izemoplasmatales bacterium]|jgi:L-erythro-3,5-diaminohexanoate dehydrogenase|nr:L-erythro-3,5-diaminohexanoate dehydrogenase [Candidatus Izemoplasmatales bacterium]